jgi:flagellar hook-associated protein 1 FlgK
MIHIDGNILVQGGVKRNLEVEPVINNYGYSKVIWSDTNNDALISGGSLGALIELRDVDIRNEVQQLDTFTMNFTDLVNDIHRNAVGMNGVSGLDFFVEQPFVTDSLGNFDRNGDGVDDSSYIFRMNGTNALNAQEKTGLEGTITISGKTGNINVSYYSTDTVETIINRINDSDGEVKAYLDNNNHLVLKGTTALNVNNPDFVIRHVEDSGHFLSGYSGILSGSGAENAYDFEQANAVNVLATQEFSVSPVLNPSAYVSINEVIQSDVLSVASGYGEAGDGKAALEIASLRNTQVMIGKAKTFDDYFAQSVTNVGLKGEQAQINMISQNTIMDDLRNLRESISGVNIDEELADMIKFQHGYNAAARFVSVVDSLLDTVINRMGV